MPSDLHFIPVLDRWLVFAPLLNVAAVVNDAAATLLRGGSPVAEGSPLAALAQTLAAEGVPPPLAEGLADPPFLGLILTRGCNQGCRYCDFGSSPEGETMSPELISQAIGGWSEWVRERGGRQLELHLFGGEPFTEPDLVEIAVHRTRALAQQHHLDVHIEASTNGLLGPRMLDFVRDHFHAVVLSLDGQAADHDRHRPLRNGRGSFREVWRTAQALADSPVELCVRCCVSAANVDRMADISAWLCADLRPATITFEPLKLTPEARAAGLVIPDPLLFAKGFVAARRAATAAGVECVYSALYDTPRRTFCPVGRDVFIVAPDRSVRSCYLRRRAWEAQGLDLRMGAVGEDGALRIDADAVQRLRRVTAERARCRGCFCRWSCAGGCLVTETPPGHSLEYSDFCRQTRLVQACSLLEQVGLSDLTTALLADSAAAEWLWSYRKTGSCDDA